MSRAGEVSIKCPVLWWEQQQQFQGFDRLLFLILPFWNCKHFDFFLHSNELEASRRTDVIMFLKSLTVHLEPLWCEKEAAQGLCEHSFFRI